MVFKFSNNFTLDEVKDKRKIKKSKTFSNKVVFVNGFSASGKTMLDILGMITATKLTRWLASAFVSFGAAASHERGQRWSKLRRRSSQGDVTENSAKE